MTATLTSTSHFVPPQHMVPRNTPGDWHPYGDHWSLNNTTIPEHCPIPHNQDFIALFHGATIFSNVELFQAYHQIPMDPDDIRKIVTMPFGLFDFLWMSFVQRNAAQTFQHFRDQVLQGITLLLCVYR